jgi:hypothetical protein
MARQRQHEPRIRRSEYFDWQLASDPHGWHTWSGKQTSGKGGIASFPVM